MRQAKQVLKEMMVGMAAWLLVVLVVLLVIARHKFSAAAGLLVGGGVATGLLFHMFHHLDIALDMDAKHAQSHTQFAAMQRLFIMGAVMAVSMVAQKYIHPLGTVLGLFGIKIGAFLQPTVHRAGERLKQKS